MRGKTLPRPWEGRSKSLTNSTIRILLRFIQFHISYNQFSLSLLAKSLTLQRNASVFFQPWTFLRFQFSDSGPNRCPSTLYRNRRFWRGNWNAFYGNVNRMLIATYVLSSVGANIGEQLVAVARHECILDFADAAFSCGRIYSRTFSTKTRRPLSRDSDN